MQTTEISDSRPSSRLQRRGRRVVVVAAPTVAFGISTKSERAMGGRLRLAYMRAVSVSVSVLNIRVQGGAQAGYRVAEPSGLWALEKRTSDRRCPLAGFRAGHKRDLGSHETQSGFWIQVTSSSAYRSSSRSWGACACACSCACACAWEPT
ncbi:hypothetical protein B0H13DRAFT_2141976 [Mycena leptocephala]|nr:hypothetical protein B0H13DRAFT_2141976 [Mycena leptocephala]